MNGRAFRSNLWARVEAAQRRVEGGRLATVEPLVEEEASVALSEETARIARRVGERVLNPPHCALAEMAGTGSARGALEPSVARSTLTRDARAKARRQRQAHLEDLRRAVFG